MKILTNKKLTQKIIIAIVIMLSFNFIAPTYSKADFGGVVLGPTLDLVAAIGDSILTFLQKFLNDTDDDAAWWDGAVVDVRKYVDNQDTYNQKLDGDIKYIDVEETKEINASDLDHGNLGALGLTSYGIPIIRYSPELIFSNKIAGLDANFINPTFKENNQSVANKLQKTISSWYNALRNLVLVFLLSELLYVGIRMMLTSVTTDKAKYKQMLMDWFIAVCLLFFLHYIMSFIMTFVGSIADKLGEAMNVNVIINDTSLDGDSISFRTNLTGYCRLMMQNINGYKRAVYMIFYVAIIIYTLKFTWSYMKRAVTLAFLTLMAPLVTLTYPLDKIGDGKAQAFNMWLKEYIFNALLQPFHLIIYVVFFSGAIDIAFDNPLFAIMLFAFMSDAEKLLRRFFKFDQATTANGSSFAAGFGGAAAMSAMRGLVSRGAKRIGGGQPGGKDPARIRTQDKPVKSDDAPKGYEAFAGGSGGAQEEENRNNQNNTGERTPQQQMLDAYDENYGTQDWDPQERAAMAMEAGANDPSSVDNSNLSREEYGQYLQDLGLEEDDINQILAEQYGAENPQPEQQQSAENTDKKGSGVLRSIGGAITSAGRYTGEKLYNRFGTKEGWKKNARFLGRAAIRTAGAATGAIIGLGAGIAGGDLEDVLKYGAAGATLGTAGAQMLGQGVANSGLAHALSQGYREQRYGGVKEAAIAKQEQMLRESGELRQYLGNNFTNEDGTRLTRKELDDYENRAIEHYNAGITDFSSIEKTLKLENDIRKDLPENLSEKDRNDMAKYQSQTIAGLADHVDEGKLMTNADYRKNLRADFRKGLKNWRCNK